MARNRYRSIDKPRSKTGGSTRSSRTGASTSKPSQSSRKDRYLEERSSSYYKGSSKGGSGSRSPSRRTSSSGTRSRRTSSSGTSSSSRSNPRSSSRSNPRSSSRSNPRSSSRSNPRSSSSGSGKDDRAIYQGYRRSKARSDYRSRRRHSSRDPDSHRAAVEAYRRRKEESGIRPSRTTPVRVAKRASSSSPRKSRGFYRTPKRRKRKKTVLKSIVLLVILFLVFLVPYTMNVMPEVRDVLMSDLTGPSPRLLPESAEYHMNRVFTLEVVSGTVDYSLEVPRPFNIPDAQEILEFSADPQGTTSGDDVTWSGSTSSGVQIIVSYHFKATTKKWSVTPETSGFTSDIPSSYDKYLDDEWKIRPSNSDIETLAADIAGEEATVYEKLKAMAEWMHDNIIYERQRGWQPKDPLETLSDGTGDCDDQSILFASLARSQGIPVWMEMGALYDQFQQHWGGHAWLKAYIPLKTGDGYEVNLDPANKEFLVRDPWRITEWEADGNGQHLHSYYTLWEFSYSGSANYDADAQYQDMGYDRSTGTVSDKPPGSGIESWKESWRVPGFETLIAIPALAMVVALMRRKRTPA